MALRCGIVGLPNVGKSTIFNALTSAGAAMANYPFCTIEPNVGIVAVPDPRLTELERLIKPQKVIPTSMEFVDIAGLVKGASRGEGLGNQFLGHIRQVDAIAHVVRCFIDDDITHVHARVDPENDIEVIDMELMLADLDSVRRRFDSVGKRSKSGDKSGQALLGLYEKLMGQLNDGVPVRRMGLNAEEQESIRDLFLLTAKPVLYVCNVAEAEIGTAETPGMHGLVDRVRAIAAREQAEVVTMCGKIEAEISELSDDERLLYLQELGLREPGLHRMIHCAYRLLGLMTYFTAGPKEVRGWTVPKQATAYDAAGVIHTDFQRGFIRAEVVGYQDFITCGSEVKAREQGKFRLEGREYRVVDGDIMHFRFNV
jgi:GTP-binding protein YchF